MRVDRESPRRSRSAADVVKPGIHCVRTQWIRGFIAFQLARRQGGGGR